MFKGATGHTEEALEKPSPGTEKVFTIRMRWGNERKVYR
jgi:hypothetical protein